MKPLLLLRPEPGLSRSFARAEALGLAPVACPLFVVDRLEWTPPAAAAFDALLLTSVNALLHAGSGLETYRDLPVHAVGTATAAAAQAAGLTVASVGSRGVEELLAEIAPGQRLLQLAGAHRVTCSPGPHELTIIPVYRAAILDEAVLPSLDGMVIVIHSPRAGGRLNELAQGRREAVIAAISDAAAAACGGGWARIEVAEMPNDEALLALTARLCQA